MKKLNTNFNIKSSDFLEHLNLNLIKKINTN